MSTLQSDSGLEHVQICLHRPVTVIEFYQFLKLHLLKGEELLWIVLTQHFLESFTYLKVGQHRDASFNDLGKILELVKTFA